MSPVLFDFISHIPTIAWVLSVGIYHRNISWLHTKKIVTSFVHSVCIHDIGTYLYIEASGVATNAKATIYSVKYYAKPKNSLCALRFWYHMFGTGIGTLSVTVQNAISGKTIVSRHSSSLFTLCIKLLHVTVLTLTYVQANTTIPTSLE